MLLQIRYATNYASASTSACVIAVHMLHTKLHFGNCSHFSESEENVCLSINCLLQTVGALRKKIVDVIGSEYLTKDTAVSQKCQQNVSKIAQRHEYKLPSAAITFGRAYVGQKGRVYLKVEVSKYLS